MDWSITSSLWLKVAKDADELVALFIKINDGNFDDTSFDSTPSNYL
jgi:hypothetical protein